MEQVAIKHAGRVCDSRSVRAILAGQKTELRFPVKPQPSEVKAGMGLAAFTYKDDWYWVHPESYGHSGTVTNKKGGPTDWAKEFSPVGQPGDRVWIREEFSQAFRATKTNNGCVYRADYHPEFGKIGLDRSLYDDVGRWSRAVHMPRTASRITLEVEAVRLERVQEINEEGVAAEGIMCIPNSYGRPMYATHRGSHCQWEMSAESAMGRLWNEVHKKPHLRWEANPWVWVAGFKMADPEPEP